MGLYQYDLTPPDPDEERKAIAALSAAANDSPQVAPAVAEAPAMAPAARPMPEPSAPYMQATPPQESSGLGNINGWAIVADILTNKGRGLGQIMSYAQDQAARNKRNPLDDEYKRAQIDKLRREGASEEELKKAQLALGMRNADLRNREADLSERHLALLEKKAQGGELTPEEKLALDRFEEEKKQHGIANDYKAQELDIERQKAAKAAATGGRTPELLYRMQRDAETDKRAAGKEDRAGADQFAKETKFDLGAASTIDRIDEVLGRYKAGDIPGVGLGAGIGGPVNRAIRGLVAEGMGSEVQQARQKDALEINNARATLAEMAQRKESGAAGPEAEKLRYEIRVGADPNATEAEFRSALKAARKLTEMSLGAYGAGKEDAARSVLKGAHLDKWASAPPAAEAPAVPELPQLRQGVSPIIGAPPLKKNAPLDPGSGDEDEELRKRGIRIY